MFDRDQVQGFDEINLQIWFSVKEKVKPNHQRCVRVRRCMNWWGMFYVKDYRLCFFISKSFGTSGINAIGSVQLSQLNSSSVQSQLKAAGIDTNSKQYKAAVNDVEKSNLSMVCDTSG